jgi:hypothetical protein
MMKEIIVLPKEKQIPSDFSVKEIMCGIIESVELKGSLKL